MAIWGGLPTLVPIKGLIGEARAHAFSIPIEARQSFPIPLPTADGFKVVFLYSMQILEPGTGRAILCAPTHQTFVDPEAGKFEELRAISPREFGLDHEPGAIIGDYALPAGMSSEQFLQEQERLYELYDRLLPPFAARQRKATEEVVQAARQFLALFPRIAEPPLMPYYRAAGAEFFAWLAEAARQQ